MGSGVGVYCEACGWERYFSFGRGLLSCRKDACLESIKAGEFGELPQRMVNELASDKIELQSELTTFECPHCRELVSGGFMTAHRVGTDEMPVVFISCGNVCPACGKPMIWMRSVPIEARVLKRVRKMMKKGCPECGGELQRSSYCWD